MMKDTDSFFSDNYSGSREKFFQACQIKRLDVTRHEHPLSNNSDVELTVDVVYVGSSNPEKLLILTSGVHGSELMCGSGCQTGLVQNEVWRELPKNSGLLLIHSLNPWGAANHRRNTEDNIDLARNFVDFSIQLPENNNYTEVHNLLCNDTLEGYRQALDDYVAKAGKNKLISALMRGQYTHPDGFSFGGHTPTWSNKLLYKLLQEYAAPAKKIIHIDYHTAIGPYGYGMAVCMQTGTQLEQAKQYFGSWVVAPRDASTQKTGHSYTVTGHPSDGIHAQFPEKDIVSIVLEFGTFETYDNNLRAMMDDHWFTLHGNGNAKQGKEIKAAMLRTHFPDDPEWRYAVLIRSEQVIRQALNGLR